MTEDSVNIQLPADLFAGKTAIVTGSSRGVGRATAVRLAEGGANAVQADVSEILEAMELAKKTIAKFGRIDLLVCNAGVWDGAPIEDMSEELWNKVINTNLKSAWAMTKACVPAMKRQPSAAIVMVSSTSGQRGEANYS